MLTSGWLHTEALVARFIFPQLCITAADEELWQDDPVDYINRKAGKLPIHYNTIRMRIALTNG